MATTNLPDNLQICRVLAQKLCPYWQQLLWSMDPVEAPGLGTMATDGRWRLYFDREEVSKWPVGYALLSLFHEIVHITNRHHARATSEDNIPADMATNCWLEELIPYLNRKLIEMKVEVQMGTPDDWIHPTPFGFPKLLALEDYRALWKQKYPDPPPRAKAVLVCTGRHGGKGAGSGHPGPTKDNDDNSKPDVGRGLCGSCSHQGKAPWEIKDDSPESEEHPGLSEIEIEVRLKQVAQAIQEYGNKSIGSLPAFMSRWAQRELRPPTIHWTRELAALTRSAMQLVSGATYRSWARLSRRSGEILLPGMRHPVPQIAMVIDTSGSMGEREVQKAISEAQGVIKELSYTPVPVLAVDAAVNCVKKVCDMRRMPLVGGGGTDMSLGIAAAAKLKPKPQIIIVLTDGYTGWPSAPIDGIKVIAVLVCKGVQKPPNWIRSIEVNSRES